eukprot:13801249-Alexandrium_andersonii.AAC.1
MSASLVGSEMCIRDRCQFPHLLLLPHPALLVLRQVVELLAVGGAPEAVGRLVEVHVLGGREVEDLALERRQGLEEGFPTLVHGVVDAQHLLHRHVEEPTPAPLLIVDPPQREQSVGLQEVEATPVAPVHPLPGQGGPGVRVLEVPGAVSAPTHVLGGAPGDAPELGQGHTKHRPGQ